MGKARMIETKTLRTAAAAALILCLLHPLPTSSMVRHLTFDEIVATAELIFHGQVIRQECRFGPDEKMIFTDVTFSVHEVISHHRDSRPLTANTVVLSLAGGRIGEQRVSVSDVPSFVTGEDYVIFTQWDGVQYASPVIGSTQGVFSITKDEQTGKSYPLGPGRRVVTKVDGKHISYGPRVQGIRSGKAAPVDDEFSDIFYAVAPEPAGKSKGGMSRATVAERPVPKEVPPLTLEAFLTEVRNTAAAHRRGGTS